MDVPLAYFKGSTERLMNTQEVAQYLRVPRATVYRLVKEHKLPVIRIGKHLRFRKKTLDEWLMQLEREDHNLDKNTK